MCVFLGKNKLQLFNTVKIFFLSFVLLFITTTQNSWAESTVASPAEAVKVTPEEFKELKKSEIPPESTVSGNRGVDLTMNSFRFGGGSSGDGAILIFAVIGTLVVIAWIPYVALLAYRGIKHPELYNFRNFLSLHAISLKTRSGDQDRYGVMNSIRYTLMSSHKTDSPMLNYGLNFEAGYYNFHDRNNLTGYKQYYHSPYWQIGPSILFGDMSKPRQFPLFLRFDLTAGTSFHSDVDLILKGEVNVLYIHANKYFVGAGFAALYLYGRKGKGLVDHLGDLDVQPVLSSGFIF